MVAHRWSLRLCKAAARGVCEACIQPTGAALAPSPARALLSALPGTCRAVEAEVKLMCEAALAVARDVVAANAPLHEGLSAELRREERVEGAALQVGHGAARSTAAMAGLSSRQRQGGVMLWGGRCWCPPRCPVSSFPCALGVGRRHLHLRSPRFRFCRSGCFSFQEWLADVAVPQSLKDFILKGMPPAGVREGVARAFGNEQ
jgi:hypothetical protein